MAKKAFQCSPYHLDETLTYFATVGKLFLGSYPSQMGCHMLKSPPMAIWVAMMIKKTLRSPDVSFISRVPSGKKGFLRTIHCILLSQKKTNKIKISRNFHLEASAQWRIFLVLRHISIFKSRGV